MGGGGGAGGTGRWGETGWDRMFGSEVGGQISWLLPAALILLAAGLVATRGLRRTSVTRASFLVWGGSLLTTMAVFSYMAGIFHQYYTVALAPYLAAVTGMGAGLLWERRREQWASIVLAASVVAAAAWGYVLLDRTPDYLPWLKWLVLIGGPAAALGLVFAGRLSRRLALGAAAAGLVAALAGPTAYTLSTLQEGHTGSIVTAGPAGASAMGGRGGGPGAGGGMRDGFGGGVPGGPGRQNQQGGQGPGVPGGGGFGGGAPGGQNGQNGQQGQQNGAGAGDGLPGGGVGGLLNGASVSSEARKLLEKDARKYTWVAAAVGSPERGGLPARHGRSGHGGRRLQRHRPVPDARPVPAVRRGGKDPLLHRRRRHGRRRQRYRLRDHLVGAEHLQEGDGGVGDVLRPDAEGLTDARPMPGRQLAEKRVVHRIAAAIRCTACPHLKATRSAG